MSLSNYFVMLNELEKFGESLYPKHGSLEVYQQPPLTYEAYYRGLTQHLCKLREEMIRIEKKFIKQGEIKFDEVLLEEILQHNSTNCYLFTELLSSFTFTISVYTIFRWL